MLATRRLRFRDGSGKLLALCATAVVAGCGSGGAGNVPAVSTTNGLLGSAQRSPASLVRNVKRNIASCNFVYNFQDSPDGASPWGGLTAVKTTLYGTTQAGGTANAGSVFSYSASGAESVLHSFTGQPDGFSPQAGLLNVGGTLYGTTNNGGANNVGSVFAITTKGKEHVVYSFVGGSSDGQNPQSTLIDVKGTLYGTTSQSGSGGAGTVFSVTKSGVEKTIYNFAQEPDGANPLAGLTYYKGAFYGTTWSGGTADMGTVFKVTPGGTETVLHSFTGQPDGYAPTGGLIEYKGDFYGTTPQGGANNTGAIFKITPAGVETVIYSFAAQNDAETPSSSLINVNGTFYGTAFRNTNQTGTGAVFSVTPAGVENELCNFPSSNYDLSPLAPLVYFNGALWGTGYSGGKSGQGGIFNVTL